MTFVIWTVYCLSIDYTWLPRPILMFIFYIVNFLF